MKNLRTFTKREMKKLSTEELNKHRENFLKKSECYKQTLQDMLEGRYSGKDEQQEYR